MARDAIRRWWPAVVGFAIGVLLGYPIGYSSTIGGLDQLVGSLLWTALIGGVLLLSAIVGAVARLSERTRPASRVLLVGTGMAAVGALITAVSVPALGLGYHDPVVRTASGTATLRLTGDDGFDPVPDGPIECSSVADSTSLRSVVAFDLGELAGGTLRASLDPGNADDPSGTIELFIDGSDVPQDLEQPFWSGPAAVTLADDNVSGRAGFHGLGMSGDTGAATRARWPTSLSGELAWSCQAWRLPQSHDELAAGTVTLALEDLELATPDAPAVSCSLESDGTVGEVLMSGGPSLGGWPLGVDLYLGGVHVVGDAAQLAVAVESGKNPPPGLEFVPNWAGAATIDALGADKLTGQVTFVDLPSGVDPSVGDPPPGWPVTITGTLEWACD